jgi:hypothetical protein
MDGYVVQGGMRMARGDFARIEDGRGILLYVWDGELWITQEGDRRDYYVGAGSWLRLDRDGVALVYAMRRSSITITAPVATHYARRIRLGTRVVYDRAEEPGGWIQSARQRLARSWANSYAPLSRPTTASL